MKKRSPNAYKLKIIIPPRLWLGAVAAFAFIALGATHLGRQGFAEDEALGCHAALWARGGATPSGGLPWMAADYEASLKGALFGSWLAVSGSDFEVVRWRAFGLSLVAIGLLVWTSLTANALSPWAQAAFIALFLTDASVLLLARHEYAATSLAMLLKLLFLGLWSCGKASRGIALALGACIGLCVFDRLANLALVPAAALVVVRYRRQWKWLAGGFWLGLAPLIATNAVALEKWGRLVSLGPVFSHYPAYGVAGYCARVLSLGSGALLADFILGLPITPPRLLFAGAEAFLLALALLMVVAHAWRKRRMSAASLLAAAYASVLAAIYLLPRATWAHHWLIATPFQYAALASALNEARPRRSLVTVVVALSLLRVPGLWSVERALTRGESAARWHSSLTAYARFVASRPDALFLSGTWGVHNAASCLSGEDGRVVAAYRDLPDLGRLVEARRPTAIYVAAKRFPTGFTEGGPQPLLARVALLSGWHAVTVDPEAKTWPAVALRKFAPRRR